jgi:hypothetical protein
VYNLYHLLSWYTKVEIFHIYEILSITIHVCNL